jgi:hypothetical protein
VRSVVLVAIIALRSLKSAYGNKRDDLIVAVQFDFGAARLIGVVDQIHRWAESTDCELKGSLSIQSDSRERLTFSASIST